MNDVDTCSKIIRALWEESQWSRTLREYEESRRKENLGPVIECRYLNDEKTLIEVKINIHPDDLISPSDAWFYYTGEFFEESTEACEDREKCKEWMEKLKRRLQRIAIIEEVNDTLWLSGLKYFVVDIEKTDKYLSIILFPR